MKFATITKASDGTNIITDFGDGTSTSTCAFVVPATPNDDRFQIIARAKEHLLKSTNISDSPDEMKVIDDFLFRCWQMGWLKQFEER